MPVGVYLKSAEHRRKLSEALRGRPLEPARLENVREAMRSPELRARLAEQSYKGEAIGYNAAHWRAAKALPRTHCVHDDGSCKGRLEFALMREAPQSLVVEDAKGRTFYVGDEPAEAYMCLCSSHHKRYDMERP